MCHGHLSTHKSLVIELNRKDLTKTERESHKDLFEYFKSIKELMLQDLARAYHRAEDEFLGIKNDR